MIPMTFSPELKYFCFGMEVIHFLSFFLACQLRAAAQAVGELELEKKFGSASESLRRGIMFANSLYL
jgi:hypothetical protein